jgi:hypothetical protein
MKRTRFLLAALVLIASGRVFANTAADNVRLSAMPSKPSVMGNECTNRSIQPFARSKESSLSDDALRVALTLITGVAGASGHTVACGEHSAL